jgi:hypothetical protein
MAGNRAIGRNGGDGLGGAIFNGGASPFGTPDLTLHGCLVAHYAAGGSAGAGGNAGPGIGGGIDNAGTLAVPDSISFGNDPDNIDGSYTDGGGNIFH